MPSVAVYFEADIGLEPLFADFYLRSLGIGLGVNQGLRGLAQQYNDPPLPLAQRLTKFVDNPQGLPNPRTLSAWVPVQPLTSSSKPSWMLVATGLITLTDEDFDTPHPIVGSVLVALDDQLQLTVGVNMWLFTTPNEAQSVEFQSNPVARGAIAYSPREQTLSAYFRTLPNPKLGGDVPDSVAQILSAVQTTFRLQADRNGLMVEVGWPWETQIKPTLPAPLRGVLTTGLRYGLYRSVLCFGLNYGIEVGLDASVGFNFNTPIGSAGASLKVSGSGVFRCSFSGAIDSKFRPRHCLRRRPPGRECQRQRRGPCFAVEENHEVVQDQFAHQRERVVHHFDFRCLICGIRSRRPRLQGRSERLGHGAGLSHRGQRTVPVSAG